MAYIVENKIRVCLSVAEHVSLSYITQVWHY